MLQFLMASAIDAGKMLALLTAVMALLMTNRRTRRVTLATVKYVNRHAPSWAKPAMIAAALVPGQADELILVAILLWPILRNAQTRAVFLRTVTYAWNT